MQQYQEIFAKLIQIRNERNAMVYDILIKHCNDIEITLTGIIESAKAENNSVVANKAESILHNLIADRRFAQHFIDPNDFSIH